MKRALRFLLLNGTALLLMAAHPAFSQKKQKKDYTDKELEQKQVIQEDYSKKEDVKQVPVFKSKGNSNYQNSSYYDYNSSKFEKVLPMDVSAQVDALLDSAALVSVNNPGQAYDYVEQALWASVSGNYTAGQIRSYRQLGMINYSLKVYDIAEANYSKGIRLLSSDLSGQRYADIYNLKGMALREQGKNDEAMLAFTTFLDLSRKAGDSSGVITARGNIGSVYALQKKYAEAMGQYTYVLNAQKKRNDKKGIISATQKIGALLFGQGKLNESLQYYNEALALAKETGDTREVNDLTEDISEVYRQQKRVDDELMLRQSSQKFVLTNGDISNSNYQNLKIADIYLNTNRTSDALQYLNTTANSVNYVPENKPETNFSDNSQVVQGNTSLLQDRSDALKTLSEVYMKQGDYQKAFDSYKSYLSAIDSLRRQNELNLTVEKQVSDELFRKQLKIDMLEKERDLGEKTITVLRQDDEVKQQRMANQNLAIYVMAGGILAVLLTAFLVYRSSRQKKVASELLALQGLRSQMNPHFIFNALNSVNHYIASNDERKANKYLSDFSRLMRSVMENSQKDFIPLSAEIEILELYLRLEHARFSDKFDYTFVVDEDIDREHFLVPPMLIQPYIENAVWHGLRYLEARGLLEVSITCSHEGLKILIRDNGIGRKRSQEQKTVNQLKNKSTGMRNTENRLALINSVFHTSITVQVSDVHPDGSGTQVEIRLPAPRKNN
jgi:tetratricopeptide (TPR) repeat protein